MARKREPDAKVAALAETRTLNPRPEAVEDEQFGSSEFFDARDVVQVKYEMVRRVRVDRAPVTAAAAAFGFSRPSYYEAAAAVDREGLGGLVPAKPGRGARTSSPTRSSRMCSSYASRIQAWFRRRRPPRSPRSLRSACTRDRWSGRWLALKVPKVETGNDIDDTGGDGSDVVDGYEQLRRRALCGDTDGWRLGLAVLQQRGVAAWLRVRQTSVPTVSPPTPARAGSPIAGNADAELVGLLASMALAVATRG